MVLTVIIPVYKAEQTLARCVESVLVQDVMGSMEVILVDDGSPDNSPKFCDEWAEHDSRIRVIHQENKGQGAARNVGLDIAKGEYVTFVDCDDYLDADTYSKLLQKLEEHPEVDVLEYEFSSFSLKDVIYPDAREYWLKTRAWWHGYVWNKIYRRKLFDEVRFAKNQLGEDMLLLVQLLERRPVVATAHLGNYNYIQNGAGLSSNASSDKIRYLLETQIYAKRAMQIPVFSLDGLDFHRTMLYRQIDLYRISGEVLLHWPCIRLICWLHKRLKG